MTSVRPHPTTGEPIIDGEIDTETDSQGLPAHPPPPPATDSPQPGPDETSPPKQPGIMN